MAETQRRPGESTGAHRAREKTAAAAATAGHTAETRRYRSRIGLGDQGTYSSWLKSQEKTDSEASAQAFLNRDKPKAKRQGRTAQDAGDAIARAESE